MVSSSFLTIVNFNKNKKTMDRRIEGLIKFIDLKKQEHELSIKNFKKV